MRPYTGLFLEIPVTVRTRIQLLLKDLNLRNSSAGFNSKSSHSVPTIFRLNFKTII